MALDDERGEECPAVMGGSWKNHASHQIPFANYTGLRWKKNIPLLHGWLCGPVPRNVIP